MTSKGKMNGVRWLPFRRQSIPEEKRLSQDAIISLVIHGCYIFGSTMSGVFLNLYLWRLTHDLWVNGIYNIIVYVVTPIAFAIGGKIAKKQDRLVTYRWGIALFALFYLLVIIAQERVVDYAYLFAIFNGLAGGFYWVGYLTLMYDVSTDENRIRYLAFNFITFTSAGLAGPALAGFIISLYEGLSGYVIVFTSAFIMYVLTTIGSLKLTKFQSHHTTYYLHLMGLLLQKDRRWLYSLIAWLLNGLKQGLMIFLPPILLFQVLGREDYVGYVGVGLSLLGVITGYMISRYAHEHLVRTYVFVSALGFAVGTLFIVWQFSLLTVFIFLAFHSIFHPIQINSFSAYHYRLVGTLPLKGSLRIEAVVMRETFINIGRVISIFILIIFASDLESGGLAWVILLSALSQFFIIFLIDKKV